MKGILADLISPKKLRHSLWYVALGILLLFLQDTVFSRLGLFGIKMLFLPAACIAVGMEEGGTAGGLFGLLLGILGDMSFAENTVLFTLLFPILGFLGGYAAEYWITRSYSSYLIAAGTAILATGLLQLFRMVISQPGAILSGLLVGIVQTLWSMPMAAAVYFPVRAIARKTASA